MWKQTGEKKMNESRSIRWSAGKSDESGSDPITFNSYIKDVMIFFSKIVSFFF